jgi:outer membrane protein TolC
MYHSLRKRRGSFRGLRLAALCLLAGCNQLMPTTLPPPSVVRAAAAQPELPPRPLATFELPSWEDEADVSPASPEQTASMSLNLESLLRLTVEQNVKIALAREQLREAYVNYDRAAKCPFHPAKKAEAEGKIWQQKLQLSKALSENLLETGNTYIDLVAARQSQAIARKLQDDMESLLTLAQKLIKVEPGLGVEAYRIQSELEGQKQVLRKLQEGMVAASAKLAYDLNLDPAVAALPQDANLELVTLVNDATPVEELVQRAMAGGPGVREMEGLVHFLQQVNGKANSCCLIPVECRALAWSKLQQALLSDQELRAKLVLGVRVAHDASRSTALQVEQAKSQVNSADEAYKYSKKRFDNFTQTKAPPSEVLMSLGSLGRAHMNYLNALRDHDKAQLRLYVLTGQAEALCHE